MNTKEITISEAQQKVDEWIKTIGVRYFSELTNMTILTEEVGELANILKKPYPDKNEASEELADIFAWTTSLANLLEIDLEKVLSAKYPNMCIKCKSNPCLCEE